MQRQVASLLSLCAKAGLLRTGEEQAEKALQRDEAQLILVAEDASDNTRKKFTNKCFFYQKPIRVFGSKAELSKCVGKNNRATFVVIDAGFATRLLKLIDDANPQK